MQDMTRGSIVGHILRLAGPIATGMFFQTLYFLVDLYFVGRLGEHAIAGVGAAGNLQFAVMALTQVLAVGTMSLIAHAVGRRDSEDANLVFNQSIGFALACTGGALVIGYGLSSVYMHALGADAETVEAGLSYLLWFVPGLSLQFELVVLGAALRGTGIARPTMIVQVVTVLLNAVLDPILIMGWLTGRPLGVAGAGIATSISVAVGVLLMLWYFVRYEKYVRFKGSLMRARMAVWWRVLRIGMPPGGEFALLFVYMGVIYWVTGHFGSEAQAGFGIGNRVMQAVFLPAMAISFATAPVAGQNFGARQPERVRETFRSAAMLGSFLMLMLTLFCQWRPEWLVARFTEEPAVIDVGSEFLHYISLNFVASSLIFTSSGLFQALGNTLPALLASASRLVTFALPAIVLCRLPWFRLQHLWMLSVGTVLLQVSVSLWLLRGELRRRLPMLSASNPGPSIEAT